MWRSLLHGCYFWLVTQSPTERLRDKPNKLRRRLIVTRRAWKICHKTNLSKRDTRSNSCVLCMAVDTCLVSGTGQWFAKYQQLANFPSSSSCKHTIGTKYPGELQLSTSTAESIYIGYWDRDKPSKKSLRTCSRDIDQSLAVGFVWFHHMDVPGRSFATF